MNNKQNLHTHTIFSDGKDTPEQMVLEAIERGFGSIGFSDHSYVAGAPADYQMQPEATAEYLARIGELKQAYKGTIDIFCGLEQEALGECPTESFDYRIGSVHCLDVDGQLVDFDQKLPETLAYIDTYFGGDSLAFAQKYFQTLMQLPQKRKIDIIGHFDIISKNNETGGFLDVSSRPYLDAGFEAIHCLKGQIPFFEVNTGAIARGYRTAPYPQVEFLREFKNCGFGVVISSDCHNKRFLDCFYEQATQLIASAGFTTKWILTDEGFQEVPL